MKDNNRIKKFNELNEEINWLGKDNYDTNYKPKPNVTPGATRPQQIKIYTEEDMKNAWLSAKRKSINDGSTESYTSFEDWLEDYIK